MARLTIRYVDHAVKIRNFFAADTIPTTEVRLNSNPEIIITTDGDLSPKYLRALKSFIRDGDLVVEIDQ